MHSKSFTIVVGSKLRAFLKNDNVSPLNTVKKINVVGQGLSAQELKKAQQHQLVKKESKQMVHKRYQKNVMISQSERLSDTRYQAHLLVDDACAEMSDHLTGQHIQGTVIIESARQMMLSVTERYLLSQGERLTKWVVLHAIHTNFSGLLFPLPTQIFFHINTIHAKKTHTWVNAKICFFQNKIECTTVEITYSIYPKDTFKKIEDTLAKRALNLLARTSSSFKSKLNQGST